MTIATYVNQNLSVSLNHNNAQIIVQSGLEQRELEIALNMNHISATNLLELRQ